MALICYIQRGDSSGATNKISLKVETINGRLTRGLTDYVVASIPSVGSWNPSVIDFGKYKHIYIIEGTATISECADLVDVFYLWWESKKYVKFTWKTEDENSNAFTSDTSTNFPTPSNVATDEYWKDVRCNIASFDYKESARAPDDFTWTLVLVRGLRFVS